MSSAGTLQSDVVRINAVRVDRAILIKVLDLLDKPQGHEPAEQRRGSRLRFRVHNAVVYPGDTASKGVAFVVPTRNLSADGMAFLHSHMMYTGRSCIVHLPSRTGKWVVVSATVVRCRHIRAMLHEVAVKFDRPIDLSLIFRVPGVL